MSVDVSALVTENIDIWSSTIKAKNSQGRGSSKKTELYGIKKLRELILELAVRGLLVPQDPNDEPASELLKKIAYKKEQLIKDKKIKKQKLLSPISDEEVLFKSPKSWCWVRLQDVSEYIQRGKGPKYADSGRVKVVSQKCVQSTGFTMEPARYVEDDSLEKYQSERFLRNNDMLWNSTGTGTVGRINVINNVETGALVADSHVTVIRTLEINTKFLWSYISAPAVQSRINPLHSNPLVSGSTNQVELNTTSATNLLVPIPPIQEQHRIVTKVNELMALCDQLELQQESSISSHQTLVETLLGTLVNASSAEVFDEAWQRITENFDLLFTTEHSINQLKQTILQLAVMGKLVPQDPNDEPARALLEKIAEEKTQLIKEKKIKKQKKLPPINHQEKPFELPKGWEWCRIGDASLFTEYGISAKTFDTDDGVPVLKMGDIQNGKVILGSHKKASCDYEGIDELMLKHGDVLYNRTNSAELVGKTGLFLGPDDTYSFASYLIRIRCSKENIFPEFFNLNMNAPLFRVFQIEPYLKQQCGQANVNGTIMKSMAITVAPLQEQHRIVTKVNELMTLCDTMLERIKATQTTQLNLTDAIAEQAVG